MLCQLPQQRQPRRAAFAAHAVAVRHSGGWTASADDASVAGGGRAAWGRDTHTQGKTRCIIINPEIRTDFDHRIAMSFAVLGSKIGKLHINESNSISTSFPTFKGQFNRAGGKLI